MIQNHATWKYGWRAVTLAKLELMGNVIFPVMSSSRERGEFTDNPEARARVMAEKNAAFQLSFAQELGQTGLEDYIQELKIWEMEDNRIR